MLQPLTLAARTPEITVCSTGHHVPLLSLHTPVGDLSVAEDDGAIVSVEWGWGRDQDQTALLLRAREQLHAYFDGALTAFDLPLAPEGSRRRWQSAFGRRRERRQSHSDHHPLSPGRSHDRDRWLLRRRGTADQTRVAAVGNARRANCCLGKSASDPDLNRDGE
jgi:hypothetical protein